MKIKILSVVLIISLFVGLLACMGDPQNKVKKIEVTVPPQKTTYSAGEEFDPAGMVVMATYENGSKKAAEDFEYSPKGPLSMDDKVIIITFEGKTTSYNITVNRVVTNVTKIEITSPPAKNVYNEGDTFDPLGMVVTATYSDHSTETITGGYTFSPSGALSASDTQITVTYQGKTATVNITVNAAQPSGTAIASISDFNKIYDNLEGSYYLTADIDFGGTAISPIGDNFDTDGTGFKGTFDGRGYAIRNVTFQSDEIFGNTLFRRIENGAVVKNLAVIGASASGRAVGLLVGNNLGRIENCYLEGVINNTNWDWGHWCFGGSIFGRSFQSGIVKNVVTKVTAQGGGSLTFGGVLDNGTMENCFALADGLNHGDPISEHVKLPDNNSASIPKNLAFNLIDLDSIDFSPLPSAYWVKNPGELPRLKPLDT